MFTNWLEQEQYVIYDKRTDSEMSPTFVLYDYLDIPVPQTPDEANEFISTLRSSLANIIHTIEETKSKASQQE